MIADPDRGTRGVLGLTNHPDTSEPCYDRPRVLALICRPGPAALTRRLSGRQGRPAAARSCSQSTWPPAGRVTACPSYRGYRFPPDIISHAMWLYHRFALSFRDVEDLLARRGVDVTYEAIRKWCRRFGPEYAGRLRRRRGRLGDTWHLDEVFVTIQGQCLHQVRGPRLSPARGRTAQYRASDALVHNSIEG